jgi:hypothetical protein
MDYFDKRRRRCCPSLVVERKAAEISHQWAPARVFARRFAAAELSMAILHLSPGTTSCDGGNLRADPL